MDNLVTKYRDITKYRDVIVYKEVNYPYATWNTSVTQFEVHHIFGMFATAADTGSFNATSGDWLELDLSVRSDDVYTREVLLEVSSTQQ